MKKRLMNFLKENRSGDTMVEIIVAFAILVTILGMFSQTMQLSGNVMIRSSKKLTDVHNLAGSYYLEGEEDPDGDKAKGIVPSLTNKTAVFRTDNGNGSFSVNLQVREVQGEGDVLKDVIPIPR